MTACAWLIFAKYPMLTTPIELFVCVAEKDEELVAMVVDVEVVDTDEAGELSDIAAYAPPIISAMIITARRIFVPTFMDEFLNYW
jgi:hypothetical protein